MTQTTTLKKLGRPTNEELETRRRSLFEEEQVIRSSITRFIEPDLQKYGIWLLDRLKERWALNERNIFGWLKSSMLNRECLCIKTAHAVGFAQVTHRLLDPRPDASEVFVKVENPTDEQQLREGAVIYLEFQRWAKSMDAGELIVDRFTDIPRSMIADILGLVHKREVSFVRIGG